MLYFSIQNAPRSWDSNINSLRSGGCEMTTLSSDMFGLSSNRLSIGGSTSGSFTWNLELQDFVAGALLGADKRWLESTGACDMMVHMWHGSFMRFFLRGRCNIWWSWRVTLLARRIVNDVSYVIMKFFLCGRRSIWWSWRAADNAFN